MNKARPTVELTGTDGNAFAVMGTVRNAMKEVGRTQDEMDEVMHDMMSGDYNHLMSVVMNVCEVY